MSLQFAWNLKKAKANLKKHEVSFEEAITVFADPLARVFDDEEHSSEERREMIIGHTIRDDLVLVSFTATDETVRVLSARRVTRRERKDYEENVSS